MALLEASTVKVPVVEPAAGDVVAVDLVGEGFTVVTVDRDGEGVTSLPPPQAESPIDAATSADMGARTEMCRLRIRQLHAKKLGLVSITKTYDGAEDRDPRGGRIVARETCARCARTCWRSATAGT